MTEHGQWQQVSFRLSGSLFVGSGRWGFVLPCRPYLPGWTLWGALVVLLTKEGRRPGGYGEIGRELNKQCWLGHLFLEQEDGSRYLPAIDPQQGGKTVFDWRGSGKTVAHPHPTRFRHGTVRSREQNQESLGRLFLTETVQPRNYRLTGIVWHDGLLDKLLLPGDALRVGGNRQVSGAEIVCEAVDPCPDELRRQFLLLQHLRCNPADNASALSGELERIVLRRTRTEDGARSDGSGRSGFGQHVEDWGYHLAPGWDGPKEKICQPAQEEKNGFRHGTVEQGAD